MAVARVMLGGIPLVAHDGPPSQQYKVGAEGRARVRLSQGALVNMRHWSKTAITVSGSGWMGPGLDGLNFDQPLELRCTQPRSIRGAGTSFTLTSTPRPDVAPWALALVDTEWVITPASVADQVATVTPVDGATLYQVQWMPMFSVYVDREEAMDASAATFDWTLTAEEA